MFLDANSSKERIVSKKPAGGLGEAAAPPMRRKEDD